MLDKRTKNTVLSYNKTAVKYAKKQERYPASFDLKEFKNLLRPNSKILDVGCASGRDSKILSEFDLEVLGIDLSKELLKIAKKRKLKAKFKIADIRSLPFKNNSFDGIWASAVLHHLSIKDIKVALKEFYRVLKPGGILHIRTKMGKGSRKVKDNFYFGMEREFTFLTVAKLQELLTSNSFQKIKLYTWNDKDKFSKARNLMWISSFYKK